LPTCRQRTHLHSTRQLAYIASLLLRTLPDIRDSYPYALRPSGVPARGRVGYSDDEEPPTPPELASPGDFTVTEHTNPPACAPRQPRLPRQEHVAQRSQPPTPQPQAPVTPAPSPQADVPPAPPSNFPHFPPASSIVSPGPEYSGSPFRSVPIFRRARSMWKPRFNAAAPGAVRRAYACDVQLAPLQLRLPHLDHLRRQAHPMDLLRRTSAAGPGGHSARGIRGRIRRQAGIREQARRSLSDFRGRLNISEAYCGYCLTLVTRVPVKRTNTVFDGG
jgi:hypothetical protein